LNAELVLDIRAEYAAGDTSHRLLAEKHNMDHTTIGDLLRGQTWKYV